MKPPLNNHSERFLQNLRYLVGARYRLKEPDSVLVAVSGGPDSVALAHALHALPVKIGIAHCNFQLRGVESDEDEIFVRELAEKLGAPCYVEKFEPEKFARERRFSLQEAARVLRYEWFAQIAVRHGYDRIATAHHLDDAAETLLYNLCRRKGFEALFGMHDENGCVIRPFLSFEKEEILRYLEENFYPYRNDSSNLKDVYHRNRIRNQVVPELKEINPSFARHITERFALYDRQLSFLRRTLNEKLKSCLNPRFGYYELDERQAKSIGREDYRLLIEYLLADIYRFGASAQIQIESLLSSQTGKFTACEGHHIFRERDGLSFIPESYFNARALHDVKPGETYIFANKIVRFNEEIRPPFALDPLRFETLDYSKVSGQIRLRPVQDGDKMRPLGSEFSKKISDLLTDRKVTAAEKQLAFVLSDDEKILFVSGGTIAQEVALTPETKRALRFSIGYLKAPPILSV